MSEKPLKVLICDDSLLIRRKLSALLAAQGCAVVEAADGEQAAARYAAERPDCVFMDIVMPGCDGLAGPGRTGPGDHAVVRRYQE